MSCFKIYNFTIFERKFKAIYNVHVALGAAYAFNLQGGTEMTTEEKIENGLNDSLIHVDFMIGSSDLTIYGITRVMPYIVKSELPIIKSTCINESFSPFSIFSSVVISVPP